MPHDVAASDQRRVMRHCLSRLAVCSLCGGFIAAPRDCSFPLTARIRGVTALTIRGGRTNDLEGFSLSLLFVLILSFFFLFSFSNSYIFVFCAKCLQVPPKRIQKEIRDFNSPFQQSVSSISLCPSSRNNPARANFINFSSPFFNNC